MTCCIKEVSRSFREGLLRTGVGFLVRDGPILEQGFYINRPFKKHWVKMYIRYVSLCKASNSDEQRTSTCNSALNDSI